MDTGARAVAQEERLREALRTHPADRRGYIELHPEDYPALTRRRAARIAWEVGLLTEAAGNRGFVALQGDGGGGGPARLTEPLRQCVLRDPRRIVRDHAHHVVAALPVELRGLEVPGLHPGRRAATLVAGDPLRLREQA